MSWSMMFLHHLSVSTCMIAASKKKKTFCRIFAYISGSLRESYFKYMYSYPSASPFLFAFVFMQTSQDPGSWVHETVLRWSVMRAGMWVQSCVMASSKHTDPVLGEGTTRLLLRNTMSSSGACLLHNLLVPLLL